MNSTFRLLNGVCFSLNRQIRIHNIVLFTSGNIFKNEVAVNCTSCSKLANNLRFLSSMPSRFMDKRNPSTNEEVDRIRVYSGSLTPQIRAVKWFSLMTSAMGVLSQPFLYNEVANTENMAIIIAVCSFVGVFTFVTPLLLHFVTKKYITYLDYKPSSGSYVASTLSLFCTFKELEFKPDDVHVPDVPGMFTTFQAKGVPLFLDARLFEDPSHYGKIMGYDKPVDLKLYETSHSKKSK